MLRKVLVLAALAFLVLALPGLAEQKVVHKRDLPVMTQDSVGWYTTGIGVDTREVNVRGFPLKVIFAAKTGELLAGVEVSLVKGNQSVLSAKNVGPWLFVDIPAGTYDLQAKTDGEEVARRGIQVPAKGIAIVTVHLPEK